MHLLRDLRYALHTLRSTPAYTLMCIGVLALGIGANAAIFSVINGVVLSALPYPDVGRLVFVWERFPNLPPPVGDRMRVAHSNYLAWKSQCRSFEAMEAVGSQSLPLDNGTLKLSTAFVSPGLFSMLSVQARIGRLFTSAEDQAGAARVAVLSDSFFEEHFHRDAKALGRSLALGGAVYTVIGVLPPRFHLPATYQGEDQLAPAVWVPIAHLFRSNADERERQLLVPARLRPGGSLAQARREMEDVAARLQKSDADLDEGWHTAVFPFSVEDSSPTVQRALYVLMGAAGFLLMIACANLASLTLARGSLRSREVAVRLALGATRGRIVAQLVTEALVVSLTGAALGLLLANWCARGMLALQPEGIHRAELVRIDLPVFAFAAAASIFTAILFGLLPSWTASRADLSTALKSGGAFGATAARLRSRQLLIAGEVALALMLLTGAGLLMRSFRELVTTGVGFDTARLTILDVELPAGRYPDGPSQSRFFRGHRSAPGRPWCDVCGGCRHDAATCAVVREFLHPGPARPTARRAPNRGHGACESGLFLYHGPAAGGRTRARRS